MSEEPSGLKHLATVLPLEEKAMEGPWIECLGELATTAIAPFDEELNRAARDGVDLDRKGKGEYPNLPLPIDRSSRPYEHFRPWLQTKLARCLPTSFRSRTEI